MDPAGARDGMLPDQGGGKSQERLPRGDARLAAGRRDQRARRVAGAGATCTEGPGLARVPGVGALRR